MKNNPVLREISISSSARAVGLPLFLSLIILAPVEFFSLICRHWTRRCERLANLFKVLQ
jgi:hypothetical protein